MASNAAVSGNILHTLTLPSSHFLKARFTLSGTSSAPIAHPDPCLEQMITELTGTNGRSSAEAARMPYSCAKSNAARKAADSASLCCGAGVSVRSVRMLLSWSALNGRNELWRWMGTHTKISKKVSSTKTPSSTRSDCANGNTSLI